jgi:hypothetical protein
MRANATIVVVGLLLVSCGKAEAPARAQQQDAGDVGVTAQFLSVCSASCPEPLSCICGACTVACTNDTECQLYSGIATCELPRSEEACATEQRSCDVPCTHDAVCEHLGDDFVCLVGRCRHEPPADAGLPGDAATEDAGPLSECAPRSPIAGLCVLPLEGLGRLNNESPLEGTITVVDHVQPVPDCFGSANNGAVIPVAPHVGEPPLIPDGTVWWTFSDGTTSYVAGIAAPGLDALDVARGDIVSIRNGVGWGSWDGAYGNLEIEIMGKGKVLIAVNDVSRLDISSGPAQCERPGPCGGEEWSMHIAVDGETIEVPLYESVQVGSSLFTNAGTLTHRRDYVEPAEGAEHNPVCKEELRSLYLAVRVDTL